MDDIQSATNARPNKVHQDEIAYHDRPPIRVPLLFTVVDVEDEELLTGVALTVPFTDPPRNPNTPSYDPIATLPWLSGLTTTIVPFAVPFV